MTSKKQPIVTIFVHGSKPQLPEWMFKCAHYSFLPGLHHVQHLASDGGPRVIIDGLNESGYVDAEHLYFFGWSGKVSNSERKHTAYEQLLPALTTLVQQYQTTHQVTPIINIITHSHGGNVALYLLHALEEQRSPITINELVLLAVPVQSWTKDFIHSSHCTRIFSLYSMDDTLQVIDPQGIQVHFERAEMANKPRFFDFSGRVFGCHPQLTQARIIINGRDPWHIGFIDLVYPQNLRSAFPHYFPRFLPHLGDIIDTLRKQAHQVQEKHFIIHIDTTATTLNLSLAAQKAK